MGNHTVRNNVTLTKSSNSVANIIFYIPFIFLIYWVFISTYFVKSQRWLMISNNLFIHSQNQSLDDDWDLFVSCVATKLSLNDECIWNSRECGESINTIKCFDISRLADCLKRKCQERDGLGSQIFKALQC